MEARDTKGSPAWSEEEQRALIEAWHADSLALIDRLMGKVGVQSTAGAAYAALLDAVALYEKRSTPGLSSPRTTPRADMPAHDP